MASARTLAPSKDDENGPARTALLAGSEALSSISLVCAAGLARYLTNSQAASGFLVPLYTTAPVGLIEVTRPAGPLGSGAIPKSMPANKAVLTGPFSTSFDGAKTLADAIAYAHIKPSFKGFNDWTTALQTELDANVYNANNETARKAIDNVLAKLDSILASQ